MSNEPIDPSIHKHKGGARVFRAFFHSLDGLVSAVRHEAAFRQEMILASLMIPVSFFLKVPLMHHLVLVCSVLLVLIVELLNSAIETVVDDISLSNRPLAKRAKDIGSAAVFISMLNCLICWLSVIVVNWS